MTGLTEQVTLKDGMPHTVRPCKRWRRAAAMTLCMALLAGCHQDMWNQPRLGPLRETNFYADGRGYREPVAGTVAYEGARRGWSDGLYAEQTGERTVPSVGDRLFYTGKTADGFLEGNYFEVDRTLLLRGRERFEISCMPCHGMTGDGRGIVAQRGFPAPASFHTDRLREVEDGYLFDVVTNGFGRMYSYASRVTPEDRWAIAAYIRALQASQNVDVTESNTPIAEMVQRGLAEQQESDLSHGGGHAHAEVDDHDHGAAPADAAH